MQLEIILSFVSGILGAGLGGGTGWFLLRAQRKKFEAEAVATLQSAETNMMQAISQEAVAINTEQRQRINILAERIRTLEAQCACYLWILEKLLTGRSLAETKRLAAEQGIIERLERWDGGWVVEFLRECAIDNVAPSCP